LEIDPDFAEAHEGLAGALERKGMYREAIGEWQKGLVARGNSTLAAAIGQAYSKSGYQAAWRTWLAGVTSPSNRSYTSPLFVAGIYDRLGETDSAFNWLARAYQERSSGLIFFQVHPSFDSLRSDPRSAEFARSIGLPAVVSPTSAALLPKPNRDSL